MKGYKCALLQSVAISVLAGIAAPAGAEEIMQIEEIIVKAQKRDQSIQDVPISIQVVGGQDLQDRQISDTESLASYLPNVMVSKDSVANNIYVRGVGSGSNSGFEQAVATFVDGIYHGRSRYAQSTLVDIAQIEVLRGPQTIYFGNNAIGGAFSVTTRKPDLAEWDGYIQAAYEFEGDETTVEGAAGGPLVEDRLAIRLAGRYSSLEGYVQNLGTGQTDPNIEDFFFRGSSLLKLSDEWQATFKVEVGDQDSRGSFSTELFGCPPPAPFSAATTFSCGYALAVGEEAELDYRRSSSPGEQGSINAEEYAFTIERDNSEGPGIFLQAARSQQDFLLAADTDSVSAEFFAFNTSEDFTQDSVELRVMSRFDSEIEWILGAYYLDSDTRVDTTLNFPFATALLGGPLSVLAPYAPLSGDLQHDQTEKAYSAFGSITYPFNDKLSATVGLRYTKSKKTGTQSATNTTSNDPFGLSVTPLPAALQPVAAFLTGFVDHTTSGTVEDDDFLPSFSVQYKANDNISLYTKFSEGFKAGGFDTLELTDVPDRYTFEPETVVSYEAGLKSYWFDRTLSFNLAVFYSDYDDLQQSITQFTETSAFVTIDNVGGLRTQGIEADLLWRASDNFEIGGNFALLDAEYRDYANAGCTVLQAYEADLAGQIGCAQDLTGKAPPFAPTYSGNIRVGYNREIGDSFELTAESILSFSGAYDVIGDKDPNTRQGAWQKIDVRVGLSNVDQGWNLAVVGKNLTNEKVIGAANDVVASAGSYSVQLARGRTVAVQASYRF